MASVTSLVAEDRQPRVGFCPEPEVRVVHDDHVRATLDPAGQHGTAIAQRQLGDRSDVVRQEFTAFFAQVSDGCKVGDTNELPVFPNGRGLVVWTDAAWIGPGMN